MGWERLIVTAVAIAFAGPAVASEADLIERGGQLAKANCAGCHSIEAKGASPHPQAPPFRSLWQRYQVSDLQEALVEGILTGHPDMPEFIATSDQASAIIAYIESLSP